MSAARSIRARATYAELARVFLAPDDPVPAPPASATRRRLPVWPRYEACGDVAQARPCARTGCDYYLPDPAPWAHLPDEDDGIPDHVSCALDVASVPMIRVSDTSVHEVDGRDQDLVAELLGITGERVRQIVRTAGQRYAAARRRLGYDEGEELTGEDVGQRRGRLRRERLRRERMAREAGAQGSLFDEADE